jgi:hypothetical protein
MERRVSGIIYSVAAPIAPHPKYRLVPHPGGPTPRKMGAAYPSTGFYRPSGSIIAPEVGATLNLRVLRSSVPMPDNFSWQPQDLTSTMDQGQCGSCWAHAIASVLGDRASVITKGKVRTALSVEQLMECCDYLSGITPGGCDGNEIHTAMKSLVDKGTRLNAYTEYVRSYDAKSGDVKSCTSETSDTKYSVSVSDAFMISDVIKTPGDATNIGNIENMKQHIYNEGPIVGTFIVHKDFYDYDGKSIYEPQANDTNVEGYHAIELIGWGKDPKSGVSYWIGRNSWGSGWPSQHTKCAGVGTFYMKMGINTCEIENYCGGATPITHSSEKAPKDSSDTYPGDTGCEHHDDNGGGGDGGDTKSHHNMEMIIVLALVGLAVAAGVGAGVAYYEYKKKHK